MSNSAGFSFLRSAHNPLWQSTGWKLTWLVWHNEYRLGISKSQHHWELRRLWRCHSVLKHELTAVFTVPPDWIGHSKNAVACLALLPHHHSDLNQLWIYKSALRSAGSCFGDNNNYIPCICTVFFTCRSQETSSKQAAVIAFPLLAAGKMRCREGKHQVCPKLGVRWGRWQQLGILWDLIQRRSHNCWPTAQNLMVKKQMGSPGLTASALSFTCSCFLPKETFHDNQLFLTGLPWRKVSWHHKNVCICPQRPLVEMWEPQTCVRICGQISPSLTKLLVSPDWCSWPGLLTKVWFIQPK